MADEAHESSVLDKGLESLAGSIQHFIDGATHTSHDHGAPLTFFEKYFTPKGWVKWGAGEHGISRGTLLITLYVPLLVVGALLVPDFPNLIFGWLLVTAPISLSIGMAYAFWRAWIWYAQSHFIFFRTRPVLLEVKMPPEVTKSPRAMEQVLTNLWIRMSTTTPIDKYWSGGVIPYFSLELVSIGGQIHFYIWTSRENLRNEIEANMYAQYPEVEITQVSDYSIDFHFDDAHHDAFVGDQIMESYHVSRHDFRINAYPFKTYIDFELDKDPKEELKVEPFAQVLEVLSALNPEEQAWIQIVIKGNFEKHWEKMVKDEIKKIRREASVNPGKENADDSDSDKYGFPRPTWREQELMKSIERNLGKLPFDTGMRMIYIAPKGKMRGAEYSAVRWIWRPFGNPSYQTYIRPRNAHNDFDWPWQDYQGRRWRHEIHRYLDAYRRRQMFFPPWEDPRNVMTTEMLATLWHPPSSTIRAPGLQRISSSKGEAPPNLPM